MNVLSQALTLERFIATQLSPILGDTIAVVLAQVLTAVVHAIPLILLFGALPLFLIWLERKVSARLQDRLGPTRVGGKFGWAQSFADGIKLIQKEDLIPRDADAFLFRIAPYIAVGASFAAFMVLPFSANWVAMPLDAGVVLVLAVLSLEVFGIILAGYSSGSKWSLFGAMREAAQMVSYEVPMTLCLLVPLVAVGSLNFRDIAAMQSGPFWNWLIFHDFPTFLAFFTYFTVSLASVKRAPFDLAEAESELVGGFHTEYSGMRWSFFYLAEYASMFVVSLIAVLVFLGGWESGIGLEWLFRGLHGWWPDFGVTGFTLGDALLNVLAAQIIIVKGLLLVFVQIWVRWTLPRLRIDQVMTTCLKYLVPISACLFLGAVLWPLMLATTLGRTTLFPVAASRGQVWLRQNETVSQRDVPAPGSLTPTELSGEVPEQGRAQP